MPSRREVLVSIGALPALGQAQDKKPKAFSSAELDLTRDLADAIIPRTGTPGAADSGVHWLIDASLAGRARELAAFKKGLAAVARQRKQGKDLTAILAALQSTKDPFFRQIKDLTIDSYYSTREGLAEELGWHGLTPMAEFPGCTHPEHQSQRKGRSGAAPNGQEFAGYPKPEPVRFARDRKEKG
ncbi:MAG: gluconate 2-dehydrogenase subunit 3 family protein [Bryobacteraceae bacterium]